MLNKSSLIFCFSITFFSSIVSQVHAVSWDIKALTPSTVTLGFHFHPSDKKLLDDEENYLFALSSFPSLEIPQTLCSFNDKKRKEKLLVPITSGWMGKDFLQWYALKIPELKNSDKPLQGSIAIIYQQPIYRIFDAQKISITNQRIILLPVRNSPLRRENPEKPSLVYRYGIRMEIDKDGIYAISGKDLQKCGLPISSINKRLLKLFCRDQEIPLYITRSFQSYLGLNDTILFYGQFLRGENTFYTQYSFHNVYWLTWNGNTPGARVAEISGNLKKNQHDFNSNNLLKARYFRDTLHLELDNDIRWLGDIFNIGEVGQLPNSNQEIDNWYWGIVGSNKTTEFEFLLPSPFPDNMLSARMQILLTGISSVSNNPQDHQLSILLNNQSIHSPPAIWDAQNDYLFTSASFAGSKLKYGKNIVSFTRLQDDSVPDLTAFNWLELIYDREYKALNNELFFKNNVKDINRWVHYDLSGFTSTNLELWDINNYRKFSGCETAYQAGLTTLSFQDSLPMVTRYLAQDMSSRLKPSTMRMDTIHDDWEFPNGLDYVIISTDSLLPVLQPLIDYHRQSGMQVAPLDIQDIYNRFAYGIHNPQSIRTMLRYVFHQHLEDPPKYLLLGGDGSHDMDKKDRHKNVIPTHLTRIPGWGPASDDGYFALLSGDDNFPDVQVGRFPARDSKDMEILVRKTLRYLQHPEPGYWHDNLLLLGGYESEFTALNNDLVKRIIGPNMTVLRMDADINSPYFTSGAIASHKVADYINAGVYAICFTGHGGGNTWSDSKFFSYSDLIKLHNSQWGKGGRLPLVFSFTCLTGFFESVFYESLGEEFIRQSANGCIIFYGASAYTKRAVDILMAKTLLTYAVNNPSTTIGEVINVTEALMLVKKSNEALPLIRQYNLLGDPSIPWKMTADSLSLTITKENLTQGDTLKVQGKAIPLFTGQVKLRVTADNNVSWGEVIKPIINGTLNHHFIIKENAQTAQGLVRAFAWNDSLTIKGWTSFTKDTLSLYDVTISPTSPTLTDCVAVSCVIASPDTSLTVQCRFTIDDPLNQNIVFDDTSFVFMVRESTSTEWASAKKISLRSFNQPYNSNDNLILRFYATGKLGVSDYYFSPLQGRPDLTFTADTLFTAWHEDSLRISGEILNQGNASASSYNLTFFYGDTSNDTNLVYAHTFSTSLAPGKVNPFGFALADTQGILTFTGFLNRDSSLAEIDYTNNQILATLSVTYTDMQTLTDTLHSVGQGCYIYPQKELEKTSRIFLFPRFPEEDQPLLSGSEWLPLLNDSIKSYYLTGRPKLLLSDSLIWNFQPQTTNTNAPVQLLESGVFLYDSSASQWRNRGGVVDSTTYLVQLTTTASGPFALGRCSDRTSPEISVFVGGKEITYLDYAAKNRPFNIFIFDSSGISLTSIQLLLNQAPLSHEHKSSPVSGEYSTTVILTAYPQQCNRIDSLTVRASDNAGNNAEKVFAYRPGETLGIKFFSCHPNPFTAKKGKFVRFAYLLTDVATSVSLTIYTISGRKVWTWRNPTDLIGYQEIAWDGTTHNRRNEGFGYRIANGTYYAKLIAKNGQKKVQKIIRIAKLEGY